MSSPIESHRRLSSRVRRYFAHVHHGDPRRPAINPPDRPVANRPSAAPSNYVHCGYTHIVKTDAESLLPLPPATFHILVALADEDRHIAMTESRRLAQMLDLARAWGLAPRKV